MDTNTLIIIFIISYILHIILSIIISAIKKQEFFIGLSLGLFPILGPIILTFISSQKSAKQFSEKVIKVRSDERKYVLSNYIIQIFLILFISTFVIMFFERGSLRFDLTIDKRFSLSDITKKYLEELDESGKPLMVRYYYSSINHLPRRLRLLPSEIETLFKEYQKNSKMFEYEMIEVPPKIISGEAEEDTQQSRITRYLEEARIITPGTREEKPEEDATEEEKKTYEIRKFLRDENINVIKEETYEGDRKIFQSFYSAFYITYGLEMPIKDDQVFIPKRDEREGHSIVPYANSILTKNLARLTSPKKIVIGLLTGHYEKHFEFDSSRDFRDLLTRGEGFQIETVDLNQGNEQIPDNIDILIITATTDALPEREQFVLDQFLMRGGRIFFMTAPIIPPVRSQYAVSWQSGHQSWYNFINKYGFLTSPTKVAFDKRCFIANEGTNREEPLTWVPKVEGDGLTEHPICAGIDENNFIYNSIISINHLTKNKDTVFEPIFLTSSQAWEIEINSDILQEPFAFDERYNPTLWQLMKQPQTGLREFILAASIEGNFSSAYKRGNAPPKTDEIGYPQTAPSNEEKRKKEIVLQTSEDTRIVVLGNSLSYLIYPTFWNNEKMLLNIIYYLAYGRELLNVERRVANIRPLAPVNTEQKSLIRFIVILAVPILLVILGLFLLVYRIQSRYFDQAVLELRKKHRTNN